MRDQGQSRGEHESGYSMTPQEELDAACVLFRPRGQGLGKEESEISETMLRKARKFTPNGTKTSQAAVALGVLRFWPLVPRA